jgi:hypothetical protein
MVRREGRSFQVCAERYFRNTLSAELISEIVIWITLYIGEGRNNVSGLRCYSYNAFHLSHFAFDLCFMCRSDYI